MKLWFGWSISKNYAIDLAMLYSYRDIEDGISFIEFSLEWKRFKSDHNPSVELLFAICNFIIIDVMIYNKKNHIEGTDEVFC
jgi:hypothetical protein